MVLGLVVELELAILAAEVVGRALVPDHPVRVVRIDGLPAHRIDGHCSTGHPTEDANGYEGFDIGCARHAFISGGLLRGVVAAPMRVGVIGVGSMGQNHARVYSEIADLAGIPAPAGKEGGARSNRFNFPSYTDPAHRLT